MLMIFNMEAAVVIGIIAALFYGICAVFPSLSGSIPPFILAALTLAGGAFSEFTLGLKPRIGLVMPIWGIGVALFAINFMVFFGPTLFYIFLLVLGFGFVIYKVRDEKFRWYRAQAEMLEYSLQKSTDSVERLNTLREALFCNRWTRWSSQQVQHNISILENILIDVPEQFTQDERNSIRSVSAEIKRNYRPKLIRNIRIFLFQKANAQGIGRFR